MTRIGLRVRTLARQLLAEYRRLNSAGVGEDKLRGVAPRERARLVKKLLSQDHQGPNRCC